MNTRHPVVSLRFALLLSVLLAPASLAQAPQEGTFLPEGIEATGDTAEVRALTDWVADHWQTNPERSRQVARRALALARNLDDQRGIAGSLTALGNLFSRSDPDEAEEFYVAAREVFERLGDERGLFGNRFRMGNVYYERGEFEQALAFYFDALEGFERLGDEERKISVLNNIGAVHQDRGNKEEALRYYEQAAALAEAVGNPEMIVYTLSNVGFVLAESGSYESAESYLRRTLAIAEEHNLRIYTALVSNNLGYVLNKQGRYQAALLHLHTAEEISRELEEKRTLLAVADELGKAYMGLGRYGEALRYAHESLTLAQELGLLVSQMEAHQTLSQIYEAAGNDGQALAHHRQYAAARDSAFTAEKAEIVTEMQTRYETEEKQRAIERFEQENRIQALQLTLLLAGVGGLLLLLGFLYNRYRLNQKANRLLEELDAAKSRFFANISHEFRTPLTVILGGLQDALAGRFDRSKKKLTEQHQAMLRNTRQLQRLIDEMLDLNRLEAGKLELNPAPGDLVRSLRRIVRADAPLAERNGIELTLDHDVAHCPRRYDQAKVEKIVGNLLSNALKFTPKDGSVRVALHCGHPVKVTVSDTGPGIPEDAQKKVFDRFAQVGDGGHHGGTGIGLALAKELVELLGGTITLESEPGKGSTFTVRLPLETTTLDAVQKNTPRPFGTPPSRGEPSPQTAPLRGLPAKRGGGVSVTVEPSGNGSEAEPDLSGRSEAKTDRTTVLIIEDNADVRAFVRRSLEETYRVLEAADGEAGLQQAREALPDLIVSDVMLPGIDGYEIARQLKVEPATECIPVVMLTARAAEEDKTEGYGSGAEVYITKPFSPGTLRAAVARLLEERLRLRRRLQESTKQEEKETAQNGEPTFSDRARAVVIENIHDEDFGVEELATALGISRPTLYRRLSEEAERSPGSLIWSVRLEKARELLSDGAGSVSEVAYAVGFKSLAHFTQSFREHHGELPSSVLGTRAE